MKHQIIIIALLFTAPTVGLAQNGDYGSAPGYTGGGGLHSTAPAHTSTMPILCGLEYGPWPMNPLELREKYMVCPEGLRPNSRSTTNCRCVRDGNAMR
jgi:hypothetical protein